MYLCVFCLYISDFLALNRRHRPFIALLGDRSYFPFNRRFSKPGSSYLPGKPIVPIVFCKETTIHLIRYGGRHLLRMEESTFCRVSLLVWRKSKISMQEVKGTPGKSKTGVILMKDDYFCAVA